MLGNLFPGNTPGQNIKRFRLLHGLTRKQLAKKLHIDEATLRLVEVDKKEGVSERY